MKRLFLLISLLVLSLGAACNVIPQPAPVMDETQPPSGGAAAPLPTETQPPMAGQEDEAFNQALAQAFANRDLEGLRAMMGERFSFALDAFELRDVPADEAFAWLAAHSLAEGAQPAAQFSSDVPALLKGADPLGLWGPVAQVVRALHVTGLGASASSEAVLVIGRNADGQLYWHGILLPSTGSFTSYGNLLVEVHETDVKYAHTLVEAELRVGPGSEFELLGAVPADKITQVVGISADGQWYRIHCSDYPNGACWIPADPAVTEPSDG